MLDSCYQHLDNQGFSSSMYDTQVCAASCNCNFYWNCIVAFYLRTTQQDLITSAFQIEFGSVGFWGEEKNGVLSPSKKNKTSQSKRKNQHQPPPIYGIDSRIWRVLSPLRHPSLHQIPLNRLNVIAEILAFSLIFNSFIFLQTLDIPGLSLSQQEYYPYVFYQIKLDVMER